MSTWQARLVQEEYAAIVIKDPTLVDAHTFWDAVSTLAPPHTLVFVCGTHAELAPFIASNLGRYRQTWHIVSTQTGSALGRKAPIDRVRLVHVFCDRPPAYTPASLQDCDFPGERCFPSNVIHVANPPGRVKPDIIRFVAVLYGVTEEALLDPLEIMARTEG